jgi:IS5 family transposase
MPCRHRAGHRSYEGRRLKEDGHLGRNFLAGAAGDAINVVLAAAGHNLRLLRAWLIRFLVALISLLAISTS